MDELPVRLRVTFEMSAIPPTPNRKALMYENPTPDDREAVVTSEAQVIAEMTEQVATLTERIRVLTEQSQRQISADDYRLADMWARAGEIADRAGHCKVYDDLVSELGGIPREREYFVTFWARQTVTVTVGHNEDAAEIAEEYLNDGDWEIQNQHTEVEEN
jgi:hypothetical protein